MDKPLVSVIIPAYNGERYLAAVIESVLKQDYVPFEVIVVDDGSTDKTATIVKSFKQVKYIYQSNRGNAVARNVGIDAAKGEFIAFLDQDDLWPPNKLSVQVGYLIDHPELYFTVAKRKFFLEPGSSIPSWFKKELLENSHVSYCPGALVARKSIFEIVGKFNPAFSTTSDVDWFTRAKDKRVPMATLPEVLLYKRVHGKAQSSNTSVYHKELLKVLKKTINRNKSPEEKPISKKDISISVIIPAYNCEKYVSEAIQSVLNQTLKPKEIIVIDDGSTDGSAKIIKQFGPPVYCYHQTNSGIGAARNAGVQKAKGEFIAFLDGDDLWVPDKLAKQIEAFEKNSNLDMVFGYAQNFHSPELNAEMKAKAQGPMDSMPGYVASTMLIKRESFFRVGLFETGWKVGEFVDWYLKAMEQGLRSFLMRQVLLKRRLHTSNTGIRERKSQMDYVRILKASLNRRRKK